ncbi:Ribokinase-like protein [Wallemia mellicola]|nr:Ribokinase-like protein [Wallemia mellicola]
MSLEKDIITLGMFIVDEFEYRHLNGELDTSKQTSSQIGGGGTYAIIGSRMWTEPTKLGQIVDTGSDFDKETENTLESYEHDKSNRMFILRADPNKATTRAVNKYTGQRREFEYLTPRNRLNLSDYHQMKLHKLPKYIHSVCSPVRQTDIIKEAKTLNWNVKYIYEPLPEAMIPTNSQKLRETIEEADENLFLSPNHTEAAEMFGLDEPNTLEKCEELTKKIHNEIHAKNVILRCGKLGSYISIPGMAFWVEALHIHNQEKVFDVTGAGNAFLGGFTGGLNKYNGDIRKAAICGTISAGYTIEKDGLPTVKLVNGQECWNGRDHTPEEELANFVNKQK